MHPDNMITELVDELRSILGGGLTLSDATAQYIDSTFGQPSLEELRNILADEDNCERDSLAELLFSPDESMQVRLESLLEKAAFSRRDRKQITDRLAAAEPPVTMRLPGKRGEFQMRLTHDGAERLVSLLHIEKQLPTKLCEAIGDNVRDDGAARIKVIFRNARCRFCERDVTFLSSALAGLDFDRQSDVESLKYALTVLADDPSPADIYQALMHRKKIYCRQVQKALKTEELLRKSNPEIMMLQGRLAGGIDAAEAERLIDMIDRVSLAVFNRTEPCLPGAVETQYDMHQRNDTLKLFFSKDENNEA